MKETWRGGATWTTSSC